MTALVSAEEVITSRLARRMSRLKVSAVREILKVTEQPDIISFAGGLPAPELFPVTETARAFADVFAREGSAAMQYSTTEGWLPLRAWIAERMAGRGVKASAENVLITSGSQQGIDLVGKVFVSASNSCCGPAHHRRAPSRRLGDQSGDICCSYLFPKALRR